jgi:hypothetical protein
MMRRALKRPTDRHAPATFVREFPAILLFSAGFDTLLYHNEGRP